MRLLEERETDELVPRFHHEIKKKRSRDFSDSQKSNFGVSSFSHTASSLQKRRILKDFFLSLSRRRRQDRIRASRASSLLRSRDDDDEKFLARKKTKERSERRHMRDLDIKKERKRHTSIDVAVFSTFKAPYRSGHSSSSSAVLLFCSTIMFYKLLGCFVVLDQWV